MPFDGTTITKAYPSLKPVTLDELNKEGFPDYMIYSFLKTAEETKSIILCRTPGGVGTKLIDEGYDLKGFQIKAKSCNWGPMAGFICRLPLFNKAGYKKIAYNTGHIFHYLERLDNFTGPKSQINDILDCLESSRGKLDAFITGRNESMDPITFEIQNQLINDLKDSFTSLGYDESFFPEQSVKDVISSYNQRTYEPLEKIQIKINDKYNTKIGEITKAYKKIENNTGEWSGENTLPAEGPFVHLKTTFEDKFDLINEIADTTGVEKESLRENNINGKTSIYGAAFNGRETQEATICMEFLMVQEGETNLWSIYHGGIKYREDVRNDFEIYSPIAPKTAQMYYWDVFLKDLKLKDDHNIYDRFDGNRNKDYFDLIYNFSDEPSKNMGKIDLDVTDTGTNSFGFTAGQKTFYPVIGFMNPHPPYDTNGIESYKNAVTGDYDLFTVWPNSAEMNLHDLIRISELKIGDQMRMGGKVLTTFVGENSEFGIEFIPGFKEMGPVTENGVVLQQSKESAELGNISNLERLVGGTLNAFSTSIVKDIPTNKAFHSFEAGRPGIMEIEYPVAIFFQYELQSRALNNLGYYAAGSVQDRELTKTFGGLIKTSEELLNLIFECKNFKGESTIPRHYLITMQADWMAHLFYVSLGEEKRRIILEKPVTDSLLEINNGLTDDEKSTEKNIRSRIKEFADIEKKLGEQYNQERIEQLLIRLVEAEPNPEQVNNTLENNLKYFNELRDTFLKMTFQPNRKAYSKKLEIDKLLKKNNRIYGLQTD